MRELLWGTLAVLLLVHTVASEQPVGQNLILEYQKGATLMPDEALQIVTHETNNKLDDETSYALDVGHNSRELETEESGNQTEQQTDTKDISEELTRLTERATTLPSEEIPVTAEPRSRTDPPDSSTVTPSLPPATTLSIPSMTTIEERSLPPYTPAVLTTTIQATTTTMNTSSSSSTRHYPEVLYTTSRAPATVHEESCDFGVFPEQSLCSWKNSGNASLWWRVGTGKSANWLGGPHQDFNTWDSTGGYAFVETSEQMESGGDSVGAVLESIELSATSSQGTCLSFGYALEGLSAAELRVLVKFVDSGASYVLWQASYRAHGWREAQLLYTCYKAHKLLFEGIPVDAVDSGRKYRGFISVDGLELRSGSSCQGFCTFATSFCDWNNEQGDDFDWSLTRGSHNPATGPSRDSSIDPTSSGGYASIDSSYPRRPGDTARLVSMAFPAIGDEDPFCMRFWFHMFGPAVGSLRVLLRHFFHEDSTPPIQEIWSLSGNAGNAWFMGEVTVSSLTEFQVVLEATVGNTAMGDIAVDDVSFIRGPCPVAPQVAAPYSGDCNFEVDECGWISSSTRENTEWKRLPVISQDERYRRRPMTSEQSSKRQNEYFLNLGRILLLTVASTSQFMSREFPGSEQPRCLTFWYFMNEPFIDVPGPSLGVLRVLVKTMGDNSQPLLTPVWQLYNNQGPTWAFARVSITETLRYRVIFEGIWGPNRASGSMGIDDIAFYDGRCKTEPSHATLLPEDCSFERGLCSWQNWTRTRPGERMNTWQKAFDSHRPAQLPDKTFGTSDGYIFFDIFATNQMQRQVRLLSPVMNPRMENEILCFVFWFAAFGAGDSTHLQLVRYQPQGDLDDLAGEPLWKLTASGLDTAKPTWTPAQVTLDNRQPLRLLVEGSASNGGFALDDIRLLPGSCEIRPREAIVQ